VHADHQVIQHGPYRLLRHPSYAGALLAVVGLSVLFGNAASIVLFIGSALVGILYRIRVEERVLGEVLGDVYRYYAARTRRLIPGVW
jgi:protein-S-isoprenylcysteine O-methyltransferase Ste14